MLTSQVFLRCFKSDENGNEIPGTTQYVSVSEIADIGPPIDEKGNVTDNDGILYVYDGDHECYEQFGARD